MLIHENLNTGIHPATRIVILGSNTLQNELLASYLKDKTGVDCCCRSYSGMGTFVLDPDEDSTRLFLVDSRSPDFTEILRIPPHSDHPFRSKLTTDSAA